MTDHGAAVLTLEDLAVWLAADLRSDPPALPGLWLVVRVVVSTEAAAAAGLDAATGDLRLAGLRVPVHVMGAQGPDLWLEVAPLDGAGAHELQFRSLSIGLDTPARVAYCGLRAQGYSPHDARLIAAGVTA